MTASIFQNLAVGFAHCLSLGSALAVAAGTMIGITLGAFPGLDCTVGAALLIPLTYGLTAEQAFLLIACMYGGAVYGGQIPAILFRIPGAAEAVMDTLDGYAMTLKGKGGEALGWGLATSVVGNVFGVIVLILITPLLAQVALDFGPAEYFALGVLGLTAMAGLGGTSVMKGLVSGLLGLFLATIGIDVMTGVPRFTFGRDVLLGGISFIPAVIGMFAMSEVLKQVSRPQLVASLSEDQEKEGRRTLVIMPTIKQMLARPMCWVIARSAVIGAWIGVLPGVGATTAAIIGYSQAVKLSKEPEKFGTGIPEGLAAAETANNAAVGGAMVPLLALGIPGSGTAAVMLGAFMLHGLRPGPLFMTEQKTLSFTIMAGMLIGSLLIWPFAIVLIKPFLRLLRTPYPAMAAGILAFCMVGARAMGDLYGIVMAVFFSVLGYFMERYKFPIAPLVLGLVLGPIIEQSLRRAMILTQYDFRGVVARPITGAILVLSLASVMLPVITTLRARGRSAKKASA